MTISMEALAKRKLLNDLFNSPRKLFKIFMVFKLTKRKISQKFTKLKYFTLMRSYKNFKSMAMERYITTQRWPVE